MAFYSFEMILVGIILLSAMSAGGIKLWLNRRPVSLKKLDKQNDSEQHDIDSQK